MIWQLKKVAEQAYDVIRDGVIFKTDLTYAEGSAWIRQRIQPTDTYEEEVADTVITSLTGEQLIQTYELIEAWDTAMKSCDMKKGGEICGKMAKIAEESVGQGIIMLREMKERIEDDPKSLPVAIEVASGILESNEINKDT